MRGEGLYQPVAAVGEPDVRRVDRSEPLIESGRPFAAQLLGILAFLGARLQKHQMPAVVELRSRSWTASTVTEPK